MSRPVLTTRNKTPQTPHLHSWNGGNTPHCPADLQNTRQNTPKSTAMVSREGKETTVSGLPGALWRGWRTVLW